MKVINNRLLKLFREKERCERCGRLTTVQPHHVFGRGYESCRRLDVAVNLISLCGICHDRFHMGRIERQNLLEIVAKRERTTVQAIEEEIWKLRRLRK